MKKSVFFASILASLLLVGCANSNENSNESSQTNSSENSLSETITTIDVIFDLGENATEEKHVDPRAAVEGDLELTSGTDKITLTGNEKVYNGAFDAKGNSCIKLGTGKVIGKFSFTVADDVKSVIFKVAKYKNYGSVIAINDTKYTLTKDSNNGEYDEITIDTTTNKTINFATTLDGKYEGKNYETNEVEEKSNPRCMINSITLRK